MIIENEQIRSRLLSSCEVARLMGVDDGYILPENYSEAYHLMGDGLVVPVVTWLSDHILVPTLTPGWVVAEAYRSQSLVAQLRLLSRRTPYELANKVEQ